MPWLKMDDGFYDHPKVACLTPAAGWLWMRGLGWSARHLRDGFVPQHIVCWLARDDADALAAELHAAGLWGPAPGGWQAHDFGDYNPSAAEVKAKREAARLRMQHRRVFAGTVGEGDPVRANIPTVRKKFAESSRERSREQPTNVPRTVPEDVSHCSRAPTRPDPTPTEASLLGGVGGAGSEEPRVPAPSPPGAETPSGARLKGGRKGRAPEAREVPPPLGTVARRVYDALVADPVLRPITAGPADLAGRLVADGAYPRVDVLAEVLRAGEYAARHPGRYRDGRRFLVNWLRTAAETIARAPTVAPPAPVAPKAHAPPARPPAPRASPEAIRATAAQVRAQIQAQRDAALLEGGQRRD